MSTTGTTPGTTPAAAGRLDGRVIALTGAGRGLGLVIAQTLVERGARLIANYQHSVDGLAQLRDRHPADVVLVQGDVGEEATAQALADAARSSGRLDTLIHNAAVTRDGLLVQMPVEDWDEVQRVNLRGAFLCTKHALRLMMRRRYGRIVYLSSVAAVLGNHGQANYAASKSGLEGLARTVAQEYARYNVRTVVLAPGMVATGLAAATDPKIQKAKMGKLLLGASQPADVAATVAFLAGPDADFVNATTLRLDGGMVF